MMRAIVIVLALVAASAQAQHQPYAGEDRRDIKALSADEVRQYLAGAGMGFAKPAELNRHPGPMHVLELADKLELTDTQRTQTETLMKTHKAEARGIGAGLVESERALEALFRSDAMDADALAQAVMAVASVHGEYRLSHLETHRRMRVLLSDEQVTRYDALRGYGARGHSGSGHGH